MNALRLVLAAFAICVLLVGSCLVLAARRSPEAPAPAPPVVVDGPVEPFEIRRQTWCPPPSMREDPEPPLTLQPEPTPKGADEVEELNRGAYVRWIPGAASMDSAELSDAVADALNAINQNAEIKSAELTWPHACQGDACLLITWERKTVQARAGR